MIPGDIVLIRFPQSDLQAGKLRPALVVAITPGKYGDLLLAAISSRLYQAVAGVDELVYPSDADFAQTHLKVASVIRTSRLATVESSVIDAHLGRISSDRLQKVKSQITGWLQTPSDLERLDVTHESPDE